ncbi:hypothetical protein NWF32_31275 [Pseudomonas qingdaonensis]|nr:hypothetical protein [Pseudomonas qingdaonensis]
MNEPLAAECDCPDHPFRWPRAGGPCSPKTNRPIDGELLEAAAKGESLDNWDAEVASAVAGLARIADAATRARSEISSTFAIARRAGRPGLGG